MKMSNTNTNTNGTKKEKNLKDVTTINLDQAIAKCDTIGGSRVVLLTRAKAARGFVLQDEKIEQQVTDYIFGKTNENPLQTITDAVTAAIEKQQAEVDELVEIVQKSKLKSKINK
jgi:hypothetical protein